MPSAPPTTCPRPTWPTPWGFQDRVCPSGKTDASVPDLDKLVKMCELFETSLDQLVRGAEPTADLSQPTVVIQRENSRRDVRTIIGLILIVFGLLCFMLVFFLKGWGLDDALVYSVPFWVWGWLTLRCKKHPVLACFWGTGGYTPDCWPFSGGVWVVKPAVNLFIPAKPAHAVPAVCRYGVD